MRHQYLISSLARWTAARRVLAALLLLLWNISTQAQSADTDTVVSYDEISDSPTSVVEGGNSTDEDVYYWDDWSEMPQPNVRTFDARKLNDYRAQKKFKYDKSVPKKTKPKQAPPQETPNWLKAIGNWFASKNIGDILAMLVAVLAVVLLLGATFRGKWSGVFMSKAKALEQAAIEVEVDIRDRQFKDAISLAAQAGNYRQAVRLMYLDALKTLAEQRLILWRINKTNYDYLNELSGHSLKPVFRDLTRHYEYAIYGDFPLDTTRYEEIRNIFLDFQAAANAERRIAA